MRAVEVVLVAWWDVGSYDDSQHRLTKPSAISLKHQIRITMIEITTITNITCAMYVTGIYRDL